MKLFLGGIAPQTTKEDLDAHFGMFGALTDSVVMMQDGRPRGFGFVTFAEEQAAQMVLAEPQYIHERQIDVKPADVPKGAAKGGGKFGGGGGGFAAPTWGPPKGGKMGGGAFGAPKGGGKGKGGGKAGHQGPTDKVFIGGLAAITTDETLTAYFSKYGNLVDVVVMKDRETQKSRGFGFVRYDSTEPVEQVMADYETHDIDGKWIEVKKAVPQDQMPAPKGGKGGGYGGCKGGFAPKGGYGGGGYGGGCGAYMQAPPQFYSGAYMQGGKGKGYAPY